MLELSKELFKLIEMARANQKCVTLNIKAYLMAKKKAESCKPPKSVAGYITDLIIGA